jgi:S-layer homology domain
MVRRTSFVGVMAFAFAAATNAMFASGLTFTVVNTNDSGAGSLREAILDSNGSPGDNVIDFAIPGTGPFTIFLTSALPSITNPVFLDGYSQPGASQNTNPPGQGFNSVLEIQISGQEPPTFGCLDVEAGNGGVLAMVVRGLVVNHCDPAILVGPGGHNAVISGNFVGTDPSGTVDENSNANHGIELNGVTGAVLAGNLATGTGHVQRFSGGGADVIGEEIDIESGSGAFLVGNLVGTDATGTMISNGGVGVLLSSTTGATIGGMTPDARNVFVGPFGFGVVDDGTSTGLQILGNFFGTDVTGTKPLGSVDTDLALGSGGTLIQGNVIAGARLGLVAGASATVLGNFIGTDLSGTLDLGNHGYGILVSGPGGQIGGLGPGEGNVIAHNGFAAGSPNGGVVTSIGAGAVTIRGNSIFDNEPLGIDLHEEGVAPNVLSGANNFPIITSVAPGTTTTHIEGTLNSGEFKTYHIDLYASPSCTRRPQDFLEGETYLGSVDASTDEYGNSTFATDVATVVPPGTPVTATSTDAATGGTSEFSQRILFSVSPPGGPAAGAPGVQLSGMLFDSGAVVTVDGVPATGVVDNSATSLTATMPAFPAATLHAVTVTDGGMVGVLENGWLADFLDVPPSNLFHDFVAQLVESGISAGIGGGNYGVGSSTLRQQMAVFLEKTLHGRCFTPPPCTGVFGDVPCPSQFADWIEAFAADGITGGCGGGDFCPTAPVRRDQMAVFLLKARWGAAFVPIACRGIFNDVPCPSDFADWIEELSNEQVTGGCGTNLYCPGNPATRGQMAVFLMKIFPMP